MSATKKRIRKQSTGFDPNPDNCHVFFLNDLNGNRIMRVIRAKNLIRGDVIRKLGGCFMVKYRAEKWIAYTSYSLTENLTGGAGAFHTNMFGNKSEEIVEYVGFYQHKQNGTRPFSEIPENFKIH